MSGETAEFVRGALVVAVASCLFAYAMVQASSGRTWRRLKFAWISLRVWWSAPRSEALAEAFLKGYERGLHEGRCGALREAKTREDDLVARAFAMGFNEGSHLPRLH